MTVTLSVSIIGYFGFRSVYQKREKCQYQAGDIGSTPVLLMAENQGMDERVEEYLEGVAERSIKTSGADRIRA